MEVFIGEFRYTVFTNMKTVIAYSYGKAEGDPGPAEILVRVLDEAGGVRREVVESIGNSTTEFAAYHAVWRTLQILEELFGKETNKMKFELQLETESVRAQLTHEAPVTNPGLVPLFIEIHNLRVSAFPNLTLTHVKRELNKEADRLVNAALDAA